MALFPLSPPNLLITRSCLCVPGCCLPTCARDEAESPGSFPLSHCSPYLKIETRKLCLKDFSRGNHSPWLPFSCVCVNSLINIAGKHRLLAVTVCHSWRRVSSTHIFAFGGQFPHFLCGANPRARPSERGPLSSSV